jgi:hypothetical protein
MNNADTISTTPSPNPNPSPIIEYFGLEFHDPEIVPPITLFEDDPELQFGIIKIDLISSPMIEKHQHILFTIDGSGSMQDKCVDGRSKMEHILHTLENILRLFHEKSSNISIHIQSFDDKIKEVVSDVPNIQDANIEELVQKISTIRPRGSTNIELALQNASSHIHHYRETTQHTDYDIVHLFLTDGEVTQGETNHIALNNIVPTNVTNIFIGYGLEHDSHLLSVLASSKYNEYRFVDALEKAGLVYGEIVHSLLFKAIEEVSIQSEHCEIYDYVSNTWTNNLFIGNLLSEQKKVYHCRARKQEQVQTICQAQLKFIKDGAEIFAECLVEPEFKKLNTYILRQRTQELLYEARKLSEKRRNTLPFGNPGYLYKNTLDLNHLKHADDNDAEIKVLKSELKDFFKILTEYTSNTTSDDNNSIIKMLTDDIYIAHKTLGTKYANMFTCARQMTQGRQQIYTCSIIDEVIDVEPDFTLPPNVFGNNIIRSTSNDNDLMANYTISQDVLSPFSSDTAVDLMREISCGPMDDFDQLISRQRTDSDSP